MDGEELFYIVFVSLVSHVLFLEFLVVVESVTQGVNEFSLFNQTIRKPSKLSDGRASFLDQSDMCKLNQPN